MSRIHSKPVVGVGSAPHPQNTLSSPYERHHYLRTALPLASWLGAFDGRQPFYGLSTRYPKALHQAHPLTLTPRQAGVYDILLSKSLSVRLMVLKEIPVAQHNALWNVLSADEEKIHQGTPLSASIDTG